MAGKGGLQQARYAREDLPALSIFPDGTIGHYVRYRIVSEDRNNYSHWSPTYAVKVNPFEIIGEAKIIPSVDTITTIWGDALDRPRYDVFVRWGNLIKKIGITAGVGTIHTEQDHGFNVGETVTVRDAANAVFNGTFTITAKTADTISFPLTGTVAPNTTSTGTVLLPYTFHGTAPTHTYSFLRLPKFDVIHVDIQVESIEKVYNTDLLIYDSPEPNGYTLT